LSYQILSLRSCSLLGVLCLSLCLPASALEITNPAGCDAFPAPSANLCRQEMARNGRFEFLRITSGRDCARLPTASAIGECRQSLKDHDVYFVSAAPRPVIVPAEQAPTGTAPTDSSARSTALELGPVAPLTLEERNTEALEAIAAYTKMQAVVTTTVLGVGLLLGVLTLLVN
jgi:hypothetical protein